MRILLISGHGAGDSGAVGNGYQEQYLTRELVNLIAPKLREYAEVDVYDQNRNAFYDVQRGVFNIGDYDYVLEIHFNAYNGSAHGVEIYITNAEKAYTVEQAIVNKVASLGFTNRGVKHKDFLVIKTVKKKGISSALLETCFIDNKEDMNVYQNKKGEVADAIVDGIASEFGLKANANKPEKKSLDEVAREVIDGKWGNGEDRKNRLTSVGYNYSEVQKRVNELCGASTPKKSIDQLAREVINGNWGNGTERKNRLKAAGYDYNAVQKRVNELLG